MSEILSQDEIDQLLEAISDGSVSESDNYEPIRTKRIKIYDFARPDVLSKESIRFLYSSMEEQLFPLTKLWQKIIPNISRMYISSVDQLTFEEFIRSTPIPTYLMLGMSGKFPIALEVDPGHVEFIKKDLIADFDINLRTPKETKIVKDKNGKYIEQKIPKEKLSLEDLQKKAEESEKKLKETFKSLKEKTIKQNNLKKDWCKEFAKNVTKPMIVSLLKIWQRAFSKQINIPIVGYKIETNPQFLTYHYEEAFKSKDDEMYFMPSSMTLLFTLSVVYNDGSEGTINIDIPWKFAKQMIDMYNGTYNANSKPTIFSKEFLSDLKYL